ncbi:hypothetical protein PTI98_006315 [Pleurotus ostreatus]|nr:hypothetical protein PTI98_006315 [Pleurotus ostreatus]
MADGPSGEHAEGNGHRHAASISYSPSSSTSTYPRPMYSDSAPELRLPPVDPRRSRRLCTDFELGDHRIQLLERLATSSSHTTLSTSSPNTMISPLLPSSPSYDSITSLESQSDLLPPFNDSCSSLYDDIESAFPQPPPMPSPLIRRMYSTPAFEPKDSAEELIELLSESSLTSMKSRTLPCVKPLVIVKGRGSMSSSSTSASSEFTASTSRTSQDSNKPSDPFADADHRRSSTVRPQRRPSVGERTSTSATLRPFLPTQKPSNTQVESKITNHKSVHKHALSFSAATEPVSLFQRAKLGTRKSFAHFRRPPASSLSEPLIPPSRSATPSAVPSQAPVPHTSRMPHIIRKVASMRAPGRSTSTAEPSNASHQPLDALCRLEDSLAKLKTHERDSVRAQRLDSSQSHQTSFVNFNNRSSTNTTTPRKHRVALSESSPRPAPPPLARRPTEFLTPGRGLGADYRSQSTIPFPEDSNNGLKSFMDITPERDGKKAPKDKMKRLFANASQFVGWGRSSNRYNLDLKGILSILRSKRGAKRRTDVTPLTIAMNTLAMADITELIALPIAEKTEP